MFVHLPNTGLGCWLNTAHIAAINQAALGEPNVTIILATGTVVTVDNPEDAEAVLKAIGHDPRYAGMRVYDAATGAEVR